MDWQILPKDNESHHAQIFLYNQLMCHQHHEPGAGKKSPFSQDSQQVSQTLSTVMVNHLFPGRQVTDPESCMMQWGGWKARGLETWILILILPPDGCGKNHLTHWCQVCQDMIIRNSEIMSGKPFELLRSKKLCKHKVLLLPSPHQPRIPQLRFLQKPPLFLHMEGLANPVASHPAEIPKLWRMSGELTIWLKRRNVVEKEDLDPKSHKPLQLKRILAI